VNTPGWADDVPYVHVDAFVMGQPRTGRSRRTFPRRTLVLLTWAILAGIPFLTVALLGTGAWYHIYINRENMPDLGAFTRFEFPTVGHVYDVNGVPLIALAREYRNITRYEDIPPIVRQAVLAAEDKRFFSHNGIDYLSVPRVLGKARADSIVGRLFGRGQYDEKDGRAIFPQGGSTITQQLVRGHFLHDMTAQENSHQLRPVGLVARATSSVIGARSVNMLARKREEMRLSVWLEERMRVLYGSKRRAKEEIFARYASFVYMGHGQYGFSRAAEYYFDRPLESFTAEDADKAALLAGIAKSPRDYAPDAIDVARVLRRRNQILELMAAQGFITRDTMTDAERRLLPAVVSHQPQPFRSSAVVDQVLEELTALHADLDVDDLLEGDVQVYSTVDGRLQRIVSDALEHGLERYEQRHPATRRALQGSVVVLKNRDGSILAETGGRQIYDGRAASYRDFNRVTRSLRQPGSAMKPFVYLAAFRHGGFSLETLVPDEPISVPDGATGQRKWISNYDGRFRGLIPLREALAESRNAVAIWITNEIGIDAVLQTSRRLGVQTPLHRYSVTALGASEVNLLELATAYRTMASGVLAEPYVIRRVVRRTGDLLTGRRRSPTTLFDGVALALIQEGLRGVVRLPTGTAHALDVGDSPIAVMGKTGTTNDFRDALFVGSTYGIDGITVAVRIGFDDNQSLGSRETGARLALPVFQEVMLKAYRDGLVGPVPAFPDQMEQHIADYLEGNWATLDSAER
jgi:penicillin-binding protein 1A